MSIKMEIKNKLNTGTVNAGGIISRLDGYRYVSFDVFDTLLKRNVGKPADVFKVMEYGNPGMAGFSDARIRAEQEARRKSRYEEVTLGEIYAELADGDFGAAVSPHDEMQLEEDILTANKPIKEVFDYCVGSGKEVYIISDIYLPVDFIQRVLEREGYSGYKKLYVSSELRKTKRTGLLYDFVMEENGIDPSAMAHIGDSIKSDYIVPRRKGICAIHIPRNIAGRIMYQHRPDSLPDICMASMVRNTAPQEPDGYAHFGYECLGPFLWGFSRWLIGNCKERGIERIFFFSRDGWIMKEAFDLINTGASLKSGYLEVSRRSLRVPVLWMDCEFETVLKMIGSSKLVPIVSIFDGVGLDIKDYCQLIEEHGFHAESVFDRRYISDDTELKDLYEELKPDIIAASKKEYAALQSYIKQNKLGGKFAIVDIGWSGGMQRRLVQVLRAMGIECEVHGFYTGVIASYTKNTEVVPDLELNGYLFDFKNDSGARDIRSGFVGLYETIFLERGGSVKNYEYHPTTWGGYCRVVRYDYEYGVGGKPSEEASCVQRIQDAALDFIRNLSKVKYVDRFAYTPKELFKGIYEVGTHPTTRYLRMFGSFRFFDEGKTLYLARPRRLAHYLVHPHELKDDFLLSRWKIGFLKALIKLPLDYNRIYGFLLRYK